MNTDKAIFIEMIKDPDGEVREPLGPFNWVRLTLTELITWAPISPSNPNGERVLCSFDSSLKLWIDEAGNEWSDVMISPRRPN